MSDFDPDDVPDSVAFAAVCLVLFLVMLLGCIAWGIYQ